MRSDFVAPFKKSRLHQLYAISLLILFVSAIAAELITPFLEDKPYQLSEQTKKILPQSNQKFGQLLKPDYKSQVYDYNQGYTGGNAENGLDATGVPRFGAKFSMDPKKGVTVTDSKNQIDLTMKPKFSLGKALQEDNQIIYKLGNHNGYLVYTARVSGVKEDIVLQQYGKDKIEFEFELDMNSGLEARLEPNGSIGVYGSDLPVNGQVSTGSENDAKLLEKVRENSTKNKFLFNIPAPVVVESNKTVSNVKTHFELNEGKKIKLVASGLKNASYPLSIDPSIYVETAQKLMRGNNETNLDFDVDNELVQKGKLTGARFNSWTSSLSLPVNRTNHGTAVYGGYAYAVGGNDGSSDTATVYWAKFNTSTGAIEAPNPGNGACASWCTNSAYNLPANRAGHSLVAYNGYLYVLGGSNNNTVYIAKLGLNGEPSLWHPTDTNPSNWVYWFTDATLSSNREYSGAVAYNNRMYLMGGKNSVSTNGLTTVEYTDITPNGKLGSWTTTGMTALPSGQERYNHSVQVYNDRIYVIGGNDSGTTQSTVYFIKVNSDGTMSGSWQTTTALRYGSAVTGRMAWGGNFSTIMGGYMYISGGCKVASGANCSSTADIVDDVWLASINADGTISDWQTISGVTTKRAGFGFVGWRNKLYGIGGCSAVTSGACSSGSVLATTNYGTINQDGEASSVRSSVASGTSPCDAAGNWANCNLPPQGNGDGEGGRMSGGAIINNGFIYHIGGCRETSNGSVCFNASASRTSDTTSYASINPDGSLARVASCTGSGMAFYGSWCVDNNNSINGSTGLAAFGHAIFNNTIYVVGGTTGASWQAKVWRNTVNSNGSINAWSEQTFADIGITDKLTTSPAGDYSRGYSYVFTRANPNSTTHPGNIYVMGGCTGPTGSTDNGLNCQGSPNPVYNTVYKCKLESNAQIDPDAADECTTTGQLTIDAEPGTGGDQGLGIMAGTVYANYIYLVGGQSTNENERGQTIYAKIDNSNNIVAVSGGTWVTSPNTISPARRRGVAFGYNGYLYALAGYASGTALNDLLLAKINTSDGSIGTWTTSAVTVDARWDLKAVVNNGYVYAMSGCSVGAPPSACTTMTGGVQIFQLYNNYSGSPADYSTSANLFGTDRLGHGTAILNGYMYVAGGCTGLGDCTVATGSVQRSQIDSYGVLGAWSADDALPASIGWGQLEAAGGTLYYMGGQTVIGGNRDTVYRSVPTNGDLAAWTTSNTLPEARTKMGSAVWNNRIYLVGGIDGSSNTEATTWVSSDLTTPNTNPTWSATTAVNVARSGTAVITYANNIYILGGSTNGTDILSDVQFAKISSDGTVGSWGYTTSLADRLYGADGFAANGFLFLFGGRSTTEVCETNTIAAPISANTTIASGNNPTGIGEWFETNEKYVGSRYGSQSAYYEGKVYVTGGGCGSTLNYTGANRINQSTLLTQPQVAKYSRAIDTDTDVFPKDWLLNGLDNSTGAEWYARYRTMHDLDTLVNPNEDCGTSAAMPQMTTWGQETNFGIVELGKVNDYIPKNSSGGNINCARYFYFSLYIDSQQAYGYPEDVTRGPTIADLTLFFTADPSKRLRHGKTFTGGEQQPLDTPCKDANPAANPDSSPNDDNCDPL